MFPTSGMGLIPQNAEKSVPYENWLSFLKNLALFCLRKAHLSQKKGSKYSAVDYWLILLLHAHLTKSLDEASDELNQILWENSQKHQRRKVSPKIYKGQFERKERKCPNGDQVRKYRATLPKYLIDNLNRFIFESQIEYALEHKLISKELEYIVDNTDQWYYGKDRYPQNQYITKGHNGPGTKRKRKYLGLMIKSGTTFLYCGVDIIKKKHSNVPYMIDTIDWLMQKGFIIKHVLADRWFPTYEFLAELEIRNIQYIGPYKKYAPIKDILVDYLKTGKDYIVPYTIKGAPANYYKKTGIKVWLIITNGRGRRLREIRTEYLTKTKSEEDCLEELMVMLTTYQPPKGKKRKQGWAVQIFNRYLKRWQIETGFRDLNRIAPPSNARTNARKFLMTSVRYWVYNCWQLERARRKKLRNCPKSWKKGPTLRRFEYCVVRMEVSV
jgi:hypothetical protein